MVRCGEPKEKSWEDEDEIGPWIIVSHTRSVGLEETSWMCSSPVAINDSELKNPN
jgi:hypothetical protein